jgi:hypothetical protein
VTEVAQNSGFLKRAAQEVTQEGGEAIAKEATKGSSPWKTALASLGIGGIGGATIAGGSGDDGDKSAA